MNRMSVLAVSVSAAVLVGAAPAKKAAAAKDPPPIASYWMDVATQSGLGAGMTPGARPDMGQVMSMMQGGGGAVMHTLDLRLASRDKPAAAPQADHLIPPGLQMGASLPLVTPQVVREEPVKPGLPTGFQQPKGRMLIYWGCGEHVGAGQPLVVDFAKVVAGQMPPGMAAMASMAHVVSGPHSAPGFGKWPNERDSRPVPAAGSLAGAHKVQANYAPPIDFSLAAAQDFMPGLGLREAATLPSGASQLTWQAAPQATGYALAMFGSNQSQDVIMWSSGNRAAMTTMDYLAPSEVRRLVTAGAVLPPSTTQCVLPAEVAAASPFGMVTMIGYGPEANFAEAPKAPKWVTKVRYKTTASVMRGMAGMMGQTGASDDGDGPPQAQAPAQQQQPQRKKRGLGGIGGIIGGMVVPR
jgi:hypothetical protein